MPVVILCGGQGTRLREETEYRPKPMVEIGAQPILWHIMKIYGAYGLDRFVLCLGYKGWEIKQYFLRYQEMLLRLHALHGRQPRRSSSTTRTATRPGRSPAPRPGRHRHRRAPQAACATYLDAPTFCFTYGDAVGDVDIDALLDFHWSPGPDRHGDRRAPDLALRRDAGRRTAEVVEFDEKPTRRKAW